MDDCVSNQAKWIWLDQQVSARPREAHQIVYFQRSFRIEATALDYIQLRARVSADSRYRLYINGVSIAIGPCKGDGHTHYYEEVDLTPYLQSGTNIIAAKVVHFSPFGLHPVSGNGGPASVWRSLWGAFLFEGNVVADDGNIVEQLHTDENWLCYQDLSTSFETSYAEAFYLGGMERVDGRLTLCDWQEQAGNVNDDGTRWTPARIIATQEDRTYGHLLPWSLAPRPIPALFEKQSYFVGITRFEGQACSHTFYQSVKSSSNEGLFVSPKDKLVIELDAGELTTGYPVLELSGGKDSTVKILYAECYEHVELGNDQMRWKGKRGDATGVLVGEYDYYTVGGFGSEERYEVYEPFWFRTFRYIRLEIVAANEALAINKFSYRETGYPLDVRASFESSDLTLQPLWDISIRTLQRCMHETYEDCPYYEQLQYAMDTRLQALFTYVLSADDRLARKAIFEFHSSKLPSGMLQSRYPSVSPQVIPGFSLHWIMMVGDHYQHFGDQQLILTYLSTIDGVLDWFRRSIGKQGLIVNIPSGYWSFVDWVEEWRDRQGVPIAGQQTPLTVYNLMYAAALHVAAELNAAVGRRSTADEYRMRASTICDLVNQLCWSEERQLYQDGPGVEQYSQHGQIWAVLSGALQGNSAKRLMTKTLADCSLAKVSYAMSFFMFRALQQAGIYEQTYSLWDIWRELVKLNLTTWVEDPVSQRSDCHAWGAVPIYEFTTCILGVQPITPGYRSIRIAPIPGPLTMANGVVATPQGVVEVSWAYTTEGRFSLSFVAPAGIPVEVYLPTGEYVQSVGGSRQQLLSNPL